MSTSAWATQQLAEFVAAVSVADHETSAALAAVERAAEALDADVAAIVCSGEIVASIGYPDGAAPVDALEAVKPSVEPFLLQVPGVGACAASAAALEHPPGGRLVIARPVTHGLTREEGSLLRGMARVVSMTMRMLRVLDNERAAREEVERLAGDQAALRRVATLVAGGIAPRRVFAAVAAEVGNVLEAADVTMVGRYDPDGVVEIVGAWSRSGKQRLTGVNVPLGGRDVGTLVFERGQPTRIDSYRDKAAMPELGVHSAAGAPISVEGRRWGFIAAGAAGKEALPPGIEHRLAEFTQLVATAIANAEARVELRQVADDQAALRHVATLVAQGARPVEVFRAVTQEVASILDADASIIVRLDPDGLTTVVARVGNHLADMPEGSRWRLEPSLALGAAIHTGRSARRDDYRGTSGGFADVIRKLGIRSSIATPIVVQGHLWGALGIGTLRKQFPAGTEPRMVDFTELVATAIANAEARAELTASRARIVASADETRRRIERDLHDGAQQRLVTLALQLRLAQTVVPPDLDGLAAELDGITAGLNSALDELRELARGIHPPILAEGGLGPALKLLARRSAVPVDLDVRTAGRLPEPVEVGAYYVVSEALTNAAKHARATSVTVVVEANEDSLRVRVRDDGVGGADFTRGSGLVGLRDRVQALGGRIALTSNLGLGTLVSVDLPLSDDPAAVTSR